MATKSEYRKDEVEAALSVMLELMTLLGEYRVHVVVVGGWVPYLLIPGKKKEHIGSLDVDVALNFEKIPDDGYRTILQLLKERGYEQADQPFTFHRTIEIDDGKPVTVEVNFLAGEYRGAGPGHRTQRVQDIRARKARGCDLAFQDPVPVKVEGVLPDGAKSEVTIKVPNVVPFIVMKGMALWDRYKEKDPYDIYFTIANFPEGKEGLIGAFRPFLDNKLVQEGLGKIRAKFKDVDAPGPVWIARFMELEDKEEEEIVKRRAFETVNALLDALEIEPFEES